MSTVATSLMNRVLHAATVDLERPEENIWGGYDFAAMDTRIKVRFTLDEKGLSVFHLPTEGLVWNDQAVLFQGMTPELAADLALPVLLALLSTPRDLPISSANYPPTGPAPEGFPAGWTEDKRAPFTTFYNAEYTLGVTQDEDSGEWFMIAVDPTDVDLEHKPLGYDGELLEWSERPEMYATPQEALGASTGISFDLGSSK